MARVLTLSMEFPPPGGSGSKLVQGLAEQLVRMGHKVDVVTMESLYEEAVSEWHRSKA